MTRRVEEINVKIVYTRFRTRVTRDDPVRSLRSSPSSARRPGGYVQALPFSSLNFFLVRPSRNSVLYNNRSATMTSLNVVPRSYDPVPEATPPPPVREREGETEALARCNLIGAPLTPTACTQVARRGLRGV